MDTQELPVTASRTTVYLSPGSATSVFISGGRSPYGITDEPDTTVAIATLVDTAMHSVTLNIVPVESVAIGRITSITVGDADELMEGGGLNRLAHGDNEVTIEVFISNAPSFTDDVQPIFTGRCATPTCHIGPNAPNGLVLDSGQSYGELVNVPAHAASCNGTLLVAPGNAVGSVLYDRIVGTSCGPRMPYSLVGIDSLTSAEQSAIRIWIDQGALNN